MVTLSPSPAPAGSEVTVTSSDFTTGVDITVTTCLTRSGDGRSPHTYDHRLWRMSACTMAHRPVSQR